MFRGYLPVLTLLVFGIGLGIGISWSQGLIPLTITPAKSGTLSIEVTQREALPPPNESYVTSARQNRSTESETAPEDPEIFEKQSEPEIDRSNSNSDKTFKNVDRSRTISRHRDVKSSLASDDSAQTSPKDVPADAPVRIRQRPSVQLSSQTEMTEESPRSRGQRVATTAYQDPTESANDGKDAARTAKDAALSPREQLTAAEEKLAAGETLAAHREFSRLYWNHKELRPQLQETIESTAQAIFFQSKPHYVEPYVIQEGERLEAIAKRYQLSWEYLAKLNRTEPRRIQIGQKLKVVKGPFGAVVDLKEFALTIHLQGYYVKRYMVGIGQDSSSPVGKFAVLSKIENPQYTDPNGKVIAGDDPSNPLGERWIDLGDSYGIHGTIDPGSIGKAKSRGCIRLGDKDIIEVYDFLVKGSEVVIRK